MTAFGQVQFASLNDVFAYADKHSIPGRQKNLQASISDQDVAVARTGLLPKITAFGTAEYAPILATQVIPESAFGGQAGKFRKVQFGMPWNFSSGLEFSMPVINLEKWAQLEKARLQAVEASWGQKTKIESLRIQLTQWYYQALLAKQMIHINAENIKVVSELMRILEQRKQNGVLDPADYNRFRNLQFTVETAQLDYQKLLNQAMITLHYLLTMPEGTAFYLTDSVMNFSWSLYEHGEINITNRAAWQESMGKVSVARQSIVESRKASLPKLSLASRYGYNWQMNNSQNVHFDVNTIGLRLDYTLFNGGYHRKQQKRSELLLQYAELQKMQTESTLTQQHAEWKIAYKNAFAKHKILEQKKVVATDNLRIARLNIKEGVMEFDTFNNIFTEYVRAQIEALQNLSDGLVYHLLITHNFSVNE